MRTVDCIVCGSARKGVLAEQTFPDDYMDMADAAYVGRTRCMMLCEDCGFVYHEPQLDAHDQAVLYSKFRDATYRGETPDEYFDRITGLPPDQSENTQKVQWLRANTSGRLDLARCSTWAAAAACSSTPSCGCVRRGTRAAWSRRLPLRSSRRAVSASR